MRPIKILLADDHSIVRDGLRSLFRSDRRFMVVGEATDGAEAIDFTIKLKPDVVILDISMPECNGIEATREIKNRDTDVKILILTIHESEEYISQMMLAGADGYLLKNAERKDIFAAIQAVHAGLPFFSPGVSRVLVEGYKKKALLPEPGIPTQNADLTKRETEVLKLIMDGLTSKAIAQKLFLSVSTINTHRTNLMKKLDVHDTASLVRYAMQNRLVESN